MILRAQVGAYGKHSSVIKVIFGVASKPGCWKFACSRDELKNIFKRHLLSEIHKNINNKNRDFLVK